MFGVGASEAFLIGLVALVVFGPGRLSEAARGCRAALGRVRRWMDESREELESADYPDEWFKDPSRPENIPLDERPAD